MAMTAQRLDTRRYFDDPAVAAFADDLQNGRTARVAAALAAGIDPNAEGREGFRPVFFIFAASTADAARSLLAAGADPNARLRNGAVPLMYAVQLDTTLFAEVLLAAGADPNARGEHGKPAIHMAVDANQPRHLELLARAGADVNVVWGSGTPLYSAIGGLNWPAAATLLDLGADTGWRSPGGLRQLTAGESFCDLFTRERPLRVPAVQRDAVTALFDAFARRGVALPCAALRDRL